MRAEIGRAKEYFALTRHLLKVTHEIALSGSWGQTASNVRVDHATSTTQTTKVEHHEHSLVARVVQRHHTSPLCLRPGFGSRRVQMFSAFLDRTLWSFSVPGASRSIS